jgi:hypothetical protein
MKLRFALREPIVVMLLFLSVGISSISTSITFALCALEKLPISWWKIPVILSLPWIVLSIFAVAFYTVRNWMDEKRMNKIIAKYDRLHRKP